MSIPIHKIKNWSVSDPLKLNGENYHPEDGYVIETGDTESFYSDDYADKIDFTRVVRNQQIQHNINKLFVKKNIDDNIENGYTYFLGRCPAIIGSSDTFIYTGPFSPNSSETNYSENSLKAIMGIDDKWKQFYFCDTVDFLDKVSDTFEVVSSWSTCNSLVTARQDHGCLSSVGTIVAGGFNSTVLDTVESYSGASWSVSNTLPVATRNAKLVGITTDYTLVYGSGSSVLIDHAQKYNTVTWTTVSLPDSGEQREYNCIAGNVSNSFFIFWGLTGTPGYSLHTHYYNGLTTTSQASTLTSKYGMASVGSYEQNWISGIGDLYSETWNGTNWQVDTPFVTNDKYFDIIYNNISDYLVAGVENYRFNGISWSKSKNNNSQTSNVSSGGTYSSGFRTGGLVSGVTSAVVEKINITIKNSIDNAKIYSITPFVFNFENRNKINNNKDFYLIYGEIDDALIADNEFNYLIYPSREIFNTFSTWSIASSLLEARGAHAQVGAPYESTIFCGGISHGASMTPFISKEDYNGLIWSSGQNYLYTCYSLKAFGETVYDFLTAGGNSMGVPKNDTIWFDSITFKMFGKMLTSQDTHRIVGNKNSAIMVNGEYMGVSPTIPMYELWNGTTWETGIVTIPFVVSSGNSLAGNATWALYFGGPNSIVYNGTSWSTVNSPISSLTQHSSLFTSSSNVLSVSGLDGSGFSANNYSFNGTNWSTSSIISLYPAVYHESCGSVSTGIKTGGTGFVSSPTPMYTEIPQVEVLCGLDESLIPHDEEEFNPYMESWTSLPEPSINHSRGAGIGNSTSFTIAMGLTTSGLSDIKENFNGTSWSTDSATAIVGVAYSGNFGNNVDNFYCAGGFNGPSHVTNNQQYNGVNFVSSTVLPAARSGYRGVGSSSNAMITNGSDFVDYSQMHEVLLWNGLVWTSGTSKIGESIFDTLLGELNDAYSFETTYVEHYNGSTWSSISSTYPGAGNNIVNSLMYDDNTIVCFNGAITGEEGGWLIQHETYIYNIIGNSWTASAFTNTALGFTTQSCSNPSNVFAGSGNGSSLLEKGCEKFYISDITPVTPVVTPYRTEEKEISNASYNSVERKILRILGGRFPAWEEQSFLKVYGYPLYNTHGKYKSQTVYRIYLEYRGIVVFDNLEFTNGKELYDLFVNNIGSWYNLTTDDLEPLKYIFLEPKVLLMPNTEYFVFPYYNMVDQKIEIRVTEINSNNNGYSDSLPVLFRLKTYFDDYDQTMKADIYPPTVVERKKWSKFKKHVNNYVCEKIFIESNDDWNKLFANDEWFIPSENRTLKYNGNFWFEIN